MPYKCIKGLILARPKLQLKKGTEFRTIYSELKKQIVYYISPNLHQPAADADAELVRALEPDGLCVPVCGDAACGRDGSCPAST